jgi:penicillin-binding protein 1A
LKRPDIAGKTGTTNDSFDAWFAGYHPKLVGVAWIGFDQPKNLGNKETGGGLALPIWISYMQKALKNLPIEERPVPEGIVQTNGDYYYAENSSGNNLTTQDFEGNATPETGKGQ